MNRQELTDFFIKTTNDMISTMKRKNADYSGDDDQSAFKNFTRVEDLGIATTEQGFLTRMTDKLCRISNLTRQTAQVKDESIQDTLLDLANYSLLMAAYLESKPKVKENRTSDEDKKAKIDTNEMDDKEIREFVNEIAEEIDKEINKYFIA